MIIFYKNEKWKVHTELLISFVQQINIHFFTLYFLPCSNFSPL